jgi:transposase, IS30 family
VIKRGLTAIVTLLITTKKGVAMYSQLTREQRYILYALKQEGFSFRRIAKHLKVHYSTVSRELRRNKSKRGYRPHLTNRFAMRRRAICRKPIKLTGEVPHLLSSYLKKRWSPEQISGRLKFDGVLEISHETIYKYIRHDRDNGGKLYKYLRRKKKYRKHGGIKRHKIVGRVSIDDRPEIVDKKCRIGDWEADTIVSGLNKGPALVTLVERYSKFLYVGKVKNRKAYPTARKMVDLLCKEKDKVLTITADNGGEFSCHKIVSDLLDADFYFAHPYKSWERGLNENTNGLIRQYFPKKTDFEKVNYDRILRVACNINDRPRKTLGYRTPREVFFESSVALQG